MASPVVSITISYHKPGTQPPLFVAGTFSDPQWSPQEMEYITDADGEHRFKKELSVPPDATIQYKFRIGHGNWWVLDESVSAVTDESGNRNNLVKAPSITDVTSASSDQSTDSVTITSEEDSEAMNNDPPLASGGGGLMDSVKAELGLQEPTKLDRRAVEKLMQGKGKTEGPGLHTFPVKSNHVENGDSTKEEAAPIEAQDAEHSDESPCQANSDSNENLDSDAVLVQADTPTTEIEAPKIDHMAQEPIANAAKEILGRADPQSGRSTPNYVKTAAEVADSAALLDKEASEPDISDGEAGRIGYRRLSSTPIPEVATTAAEVADSAQILDKPQPVFEFEIRSAEYDDYIDDDVTYGDHKPPLFSHECVGMVQDSKHEEVHEANDDWAQDRERGRSSAEYDVDRMDLNDPTLENFPSRRAEILSTVRKIETGLGEDYSYYEGVPPSPVVGTTRRGANDILGDPLATSPIAISPVLTRSQDRLRVSRSPHGSTSSLSLQSISEAEEPEPPEETFPRSLRLSPGKPQELGPKTLRTPDSDEDEGVAMKAGVKLDKNSRSEHEASLSPGEAAVPPTTLTPEIPPEPVPDSSDPVPEVAVGKTPRELPSHEDAPKTPKTILEENDENNSPRIVLQPADETPGDLPTPAQVKSTDDSQARSLGSETDATATSTQLSKRIVANAPNRSRPGTPASIRSNQLQADKDGWFSAFFRVLFDWIGGIISKLVGKR